MKLKVLERSFDNQGKLAGKYIVGLEMEAESPIDTAVLTYVYRNLPYFREQIELSREQKPEGEVQGGQELRNDGQEETGETVRADVPGQGSVAEAPPEGIERPGGDDEVQEPADRGA